MKLNDLIRVADEAYPDGVLAAQWDFDKEDVRPWGEAKEGQSDTLARFICVELKETFDADANDVDQVTGACDVITRAQDEVGSVALAFMNLSDSLEGAG